ncbi:MAG: hypothetical protein AAF798_08470 [Bacteroidota bacterium]
MEERISIAFGLSEDFAWPVVGIGVVVWLLLLFLAFRRPNKRFLWIRIPVVTLAMICLLALVLQPQRPQTQTATHLVILTENAKTEALDSLRVHYPNIALRQWPLQSVAPATLPSAVTDVHLLGDGLPEAQLQALDTYRLHFHLNPLPQGITHIQATPEVQAGDSVRLVGQFYQTDSLATDLQLVGPSGAVPLGRFARKGTHSFRYAAVAKKAGTYEYQLVQSSAERVDTLGIVPVLIRPEQTIRVLLVNASPSFESKYLKNWLTDAGYPIAVRSTISRGQFITEFHNATERSLSRLTTSLLQQYDVLLLPMDAFSTFSESEKNALARAVQNGLGLLVLATSMDKTVPPGLQRLMPRVVPSPTQQKATFAIDQQLFELTTSPFRFVEDLSLFPVQRDSRGVIVAGYTLRNRGKRGLSILTDTYRLLLDGQKTTYASIWTPLLEQLSRRKAAEEQWDMVPKNTSIPFSPIRITRTGKGDAGPIQVDGSQHYPMAHPFDAEQNSYNLQTPKGGWYAVQTDTTAEAAWSFRVSSADEWESIRRTALLERNRAWAAAHAQSDDAVVLSSVFQPVARWWFYVPLLLCLGFLWWEEKG